MLEQIRSLLKATPFRAFSVYLADGRKLKVPHPDFAHVPKPGLFFYFHDEDNFGELVSGAETICRDLLERVEDRGRDMRRDASPLRSERPGLLGHDSR